MGTGNLHPGIFRLGFANSERKLTRELILEVEENGLIPSHVILLMETPDTCLSVLVDLFCSSLV